MTRGVRTADWPTVGMVLQREQAHSTAPRRGSAAASAAAMAAALTTTTTTTRETRRRCIYSTRTSAAGWEINNRGGRRSLDVGGGGVSSGGGIGGLCCCVYREHGYIILLYIGCRARGRHICVFYMCLPHAVTPDGYHPCRSAVTDDAA